jgi:hypothetical protein
LISASEMKNRWICKGLLASSSKGSLDFVFILFNSFLINCKINLGFLFFMVESDNFSIFIYVTGFCVDHKVQGIIL